MDRYQKIEKNAKVGSGTYGEVYKAKDKQTNKIVAMKRIRIDVDSDGMPPTTLREIAVLRQLRHDNIVELNDVVQSDGRIYLIFEFVDKDLKKYIEVTDHPLSPELVNSFALQLLEGIDFCHTRGIIHRDLKPQNLLVSHDGTLKIADFGLARAFIPPIRPFTHEVVTLWYRAPEILLGCKTYTLALDLWSIGAIFAEMVTKKPLFPGDSEIDELFKIFRILGTPNEDTFPGVTCLQDWNDTFPVWPALNLARYVDGLTEMGLDLLEQLLVLDPRKRFSAREALDHPYFSDSIDSNQ